ncbi:MAG: hypothetical protein ACXVGO_05155 [Mycobacterium sp.]
MPAPLPDDLISLLRTVVINIVDGHQKARNLTRGLDNAARAGFVVSCVVWADSSPALASPASSSAVRDAQ